MDEEDHEFAMEEDGLLGEAAQEFPAEGAWDHPPPEAAAEVVTGRRLSRKTPAQNTTYGPSKLTMVEYLAVKRSHLKVKRLQGMGNKKARSLAWRKLYSFTASTRRRLDDEGTAVPLGAVYIVPHRSHRIVKGHDLSTIFCTVCAARSTGNAKLRNLAKPCAGLRPGSAGGLRMLLAGVRPAPGAQLPANFRRKALRKRWW
jgi:hypothetical protein